jgi:hypothetical protein
MWSSKYTAFVLSIILKMYSSFVLTLYDEIKLFYSICDFLRSYETVENRTRVVRMLFTQNNPINNNLKFGMRFVGRSVYGRETCSPR